MTADCFLCLCPRKKVEPDGSNLIRQCENTSAIQASLDRLDFNGKQKRIVCMAGGGIAVEATGTRPEVVVVGKTMAVLIGIIQNYAYLVRKYLVTELGLSKSVSLEAIRQGVPISEAALLCKLYQRLGTGMLTKLRGRFGFCLYDSTTEKVLAARDPTGSVGLVQGQTREGDLFIASGSVRPEGALNVVDIHPGKYKYGWRAAPRKFASPQVTVENRAAVATDAAAAALAGIAVKKKLPSAENCGEKSEQILCRSSPLRRSSCTTTDLSSSCETGSLMEGRDLSTSTSLPSLQTSELDLQSGWDSASELEGSWSGRLAADQKAKKSDKVVLKFCHALAAAIRGDQETGSVYDSRSSNMRTQSSDDVSLADASGSDESSVTAFSVSDESHRVNSPMRVTPDFVDGFELETIVFDGEDCSATTIFPHEGSLSRDAMGKCPRTFDAPKTRRGLSNVQEKRWRYA